MVVDVADGDRPTPSSTSRRTASSRVSPGSTTAASVDNIVARGNRAEWPDPRAIAAMHQHDHGGLGVRGNAATYMKCTGPRRPELLFPQPRPQTPQAPRR